LQSANVQEGITGAIAEFDEAEAFVAFEPFNCGIDWIARRSGARSRGATTLGKTATSTTTEITHRGGVKLRSAVGAGRAVVTRLVTHRAIVIEATLSWASEIFTFAHVYLLVSA